MKNLEKIDKIFSEGLHNFERQPRSEAWEKLQARLEKPQSKVLPLWWKFASAASVALLLGVGGYWYNSQKINSERGFASTKMNNVNRKNISSISISESEKLTNSNHAQNKSHWRGEKKCFLRPEIVIDEERKFSEETIEYLSEKQEIIQTVKAPSIESKNIKEQNTIVLVLEDTKPKVAKAEEETIVLNFVEAKQEAVAQIDPTEENLKKQSRLGKIWQQLKRAKNGEDVNWGEVGIKPQKVLARADAKIENALTKGENNEK